MKTIDFSYFIERYNAGEMSSEEKQWFKKELIGNDMLQKEVSLRKITDEVLDRQDIILLRNKLSDIERRREENIPVRRTKKSVYVRYAAFIVALFLVGSITLLHKKDISTEELNSRFYKPYQALTPSRSASSENETEFNLGLEYYSNGDYKTAKLHFRKVLESEPGDIQTNFLYGASNFNDGNFVDAESSFENVISDNNNHFIETAQWYLAGCYINTNEKELAVNQLEIIINEEGNYYRKDAKKLLRSLNKTK